MFFVKGDGEEEGGGGFEGVCTGAATGEGHLNASRQLQNSLINLQVNRV